MDCAEPCEVQLLREITLTSASYNAPCRVDRTCVCKHWQTTQESMASSVPWQGYHTLLETKIQPNQLFLTVAFGFLHQAGKLGAHRVAADAVALGDFLGG